MTRGRGNFAALVAATGAALLLAGCGDDTAEHAEHATSTPAAATSSAATSTPSTTTAPAARSPRGNLVKAVGEQAAIGRPGEDPAITWTVTHIGVDEPCTEPGAVPPERGHFVRVSLEAATGPEFAADALPGGFHPLNNWTIVDSDGVTQPEASSTAATMCRGAQWPEQLAPGSRYRFDVVFDARTPHGVLALVPSSRAAGGWEWAF